MISGSLKGSTHQVVCTHLIDSLYQGNINLSYQRHGFGFLLTLDFDAYLGFFKYNQPHGQGLVILKDGSIIYGCFKKGQITGITLTQTHSQLQIGLFTDIGMVGIGFQYNNEAKLWKMNRYYKGVAIQTLNEQTLDIDEGIPEMLNLQPSILQHFIRYRSGQYFSISQNQVNQSPVEDLNNFYIHRLNKNTIFYGSIIEEKYEGIGILYESKCKQIVEGGFYRQGMLHGYGFKNDKIQQKQEIGKFYMGKKQGLFIQQTDTMTQFKFYSRQTGSIQQKNGVTIDQLKKQQKIYHYKQNNFLSHRHCIEFSLFKQIVQSGIDRIYKIQKQADRSKQTHKTPRGKSSNMKTKVRNVYPIGSPSSEKTSIQIMKEKISSLSRKKGKVQNGRQAKKINISIIENQEDPYKDAARIEEESDLEIANEQAPIWQEPNSSNPRTKFSFINSKRGL